MKEGRKGGREGRKKGMQEPIECKGGDNGRLEGWKAGRLEGWKVKLKMKEGREEWKERTRE
jgi:hypothetical protein